MTSADEDYKAFILPIHRQHGVLLLYCTRKKSKGPHHQLPGGHVDKEDFDDAATRASVIGQTNDHHLLMACKIGAARELFEETGMDLRNSLERLNPIQVQKHGHDTGDKLSCQFKKRVFFSVDITDDDLFTTGVGLVKAINKDLSHLKLKLSHEHQGFLFEPSIAKAVEMLIKHSGGKITSALKAATELGTIEYSEPEKTKPNDIEEQQPENSTYHVAAKEIPPAKEDTSLFECFNNCWKGK